MQMVNMYTPYLRQCGSQKSRKYQLLSVRETLYVAPLGPVSTLSSALRLQLWLSGNCTVANLQLTPEMRPVLLGQDVSINRESFLSIPGRRHRRSLPAQG